MLELKNTEYGYQVWPILPLIFEKEKFLSFTDNSVACAWLTILDSKTLKCVLKNTYFFTKVIMASYRQVVIIWEKKQLKSRRLNTK